MKLSWLKVRKFMMECAMTYPDRGGVIRVEIGMESEGYVIARFYFRDGTTLPFAAFICQEQLEDRLRHGGRGLTMRVRRDVQGWLGAILLGAACFGFYFLWLWIGGAR